MNRLLTRTSAIRTHEAQPRAGGEQYPNAVIKIEESTSTGTSGGQTANSTGISISISGKETIRKR